MIIEIIFPQVTQHRPSSFYSYGTHSLTFHQTEAEIMFILSFVFIICFFCSLNLIWDIQEHKNLFCAWLIVKMWGPECFHISTLHPFSLSPSHTHTCILFLHPSRLICLVTLNGVLYHIFNTDLK